MIKVRLSNHYDVTKVFQYKLQADYSLTTSISKKFLNRFIFDLTPTLYSQAPIYCVILLLVVDNVYLVFASSKNNMVRDPGARRRLGQNATRPIEHFSILR